MRKPDRVVWIIGIVGSLVVAGMFAFSLVTLATAYPGPTVVHYVTETRQDAEVHALSQCEEQNTGGGAPQYGLCISEVEKAFHG